MGYQRTVPVPNVAETTHSMNDSYVFEWVIFKWNEQKRHASKYQSRVYIKLPRRRGSGVVGAKFYHCVICRWEYMCCFDHEHF